MPSTSYHISIELFKLSQVKKFMQPSTTSVQAVQDWLKSKGINASTLAGHGDWLGFSATVEQANELFEANFTVFKHHQTGKSEIRTLQYSIPSTLKGHLDLVHPTVT
jgi:tripeptidyl-peptidase-1